jgi:ABC-type multidrug transport system fused ATPase/permease subunit
MSSTAELVLRPHNQPNRADQACRPGLHAVSITLDNVTKVYESQSGDEVWALDRLDFAIDAGQFVSVVGPSGCGKSTLLLMLAGLIPVTSGTIRLNGEAVTRPHPQIAVVFQRDLLLYWRRVLDNVLSKSGAGDVRNSSSRPSSCSTRSDLRNFPTDSSTSFQAACVSVSQFVGLWSRIPAC